MKIDESPSEDRIDLIYLIDGTGFKSELRRSRRGQHDFEARIHEGSDRSADGDRTRRINRIGACPAAD